MNGRNPVTVLLILAISILAGFPVQAGYRAGYWECQGGRWVAIGDPGHGEPLKRCGSPEITIPDNEAACRTAGGHWGLAGLSRNPICRMPTRDGGQMCTDGAECDGLCLAKPSEAQLRLIRLGIPVATAGTCTPTVQVFGCVAIVRQGKVSNLMCRD